MLENRYSGFYIRILTGVLAPRAPASIVSKLNAAVNDALRSPEISANFARFSAQAKVGSPRLRRLVGRSPEIGLWSELGREARVAASPRMMAAM
jgi:hypothetical protein